MLNKKKEINTKELNDVISLSKKILNVLYVFMIKQTETQSFSYAYALKQ